MQEGRRPANGGGARGALESGEKAETVQTNAEERNAGGDDGGGAGGRERRSLAELTSLSVADGRINLGELTSGRLPFFRVI